MMLSRRRFVVLLVLCGLLLACSTTTSPPVAMTTPVPVSELQFDDTVMRDRFLALDQCTSDIAQGEAWRRIPYTLMGNFYGAKWCSGDGAREDCQIAEGTRYNRDQHVITLATLAYPDRFPEVFGVDFNVLRVPMAEGWGVQFSYSEDGQMVLGPGASIVFNAFASNGEPTDRVVLSYNPSYKVYETTIYVPAPEGEATATVHDGITPFLASATAMRDSGLERTEALSAEVRRAIQEGQVQACEYGPPRDPLPPECMLRELTAEEEAQALAEADAFFARQEALLTSEYEAMYGALMAAFPFEGCWK